MRLSGTIVGLFSTCWTVVALAVPSQHVDSHAIFRRQNALAAFNPSFDFQVEKPIPVPTSGPCVVQQVLMQHVFGNSYGQPYVGTYTPPSCDFNSVVFNFTVTSQGRQFDRLAIMYLGDIEVWRTSTAEPTSSGIIWTYTKDMSQYLSLWEQPQTIIFELDNIVDSTYTGSYTTTLTATFFHQDNAPTKADLILPISMEKGKAGMGSVFSLPSQNASNRASISLSANGQINEEFWYTNVLTSDIDTFDSTAGQLLGGGPFREVQLFIDGHLAGVAWPFAIIFTGGIVPGFWRPIVGIDAFDLREYEVDITPFLPYLLDGKPHTYEIRVAAVDNNGGNGPATISQNSLGSFWLVTGKIFAFTGSQKYSGSHALPSITGVQPYVQTTHHITSLPNGTNTSLAYSVNAARSFSVSSPSGTWKQSLSYSNQGLLTNGGLTQINKQTTLGTSNSQDLSDPSYSGSVQYSYPITVNSTFAELADGGIIIDASLDRTLQITSSGRPDISLFTLVGGPSNLNTRQYGSATYSSDPVDSYSTGDTTQTFQEQSYGTTYTRNVHAVNGVVVSDSSASTPPFPFQSDIRDPSLIRPDTADGLGGAKAFIGRGPGAWPKIL